MAHIVCDGACHVLCSALNLLGFALNHVFIHFSTSLLSSRWDARIFTLVSKHSVSVHYPPEFVEPVVELPDVELLGVESEPPVEGLLLDESVVFELSVPAPLLPGWLEPCVVSGWGFVVVVFVWTSTLTFGVGCEAGGTITGAG